MRDRKGCMKGNRSSRTKRNAMINMPENYGQYGTTDFQKTAQNQHGYCSGE